jgi:hypothetical protein
MRRPAVVLRKLIDELNAIEDPAERGAVATETLEQFKELNAEVAQIRQGAAAELKDQGLTYKQIGERFGRPGRPLHFSRIQQIIKGEATGRWAKVARTDAALEWFRELGHQVDAGAAEDDGHGRPQWACTLCGETLNLTAAGKPASSSGNARCKHEKRA